MVEGDLFRTQRDPHVSLDGELADAGFDDAEEIGRGGFGTVYRCTQPELDRTVAVKVLTTDLDETNRERFLREQRAMGRLTGHPNIVGVLQVGKTASGRPYLVMQYHPQGNLETRIRERGPLPVDEVLRLGVKIAGALDKVHALGIVHRDVKPANVLYTSFDEPALTDFGISHVTGGFQTATGIITGSPAFTAPEVLSGDPPTPAADVYGLGATLFCALTGHAAYERRSGEQVIAQFLRITSQPAPDLRESGVSDRLATIIEKAMALDPAARPTSAGMAAELRALRPDEPTARPEMTARNLDTEPDSGIAEAAAPTQPVPTRLPEELTSFVGRRSELTDIRNALGSARLVTLTGIGGVGKTRLALRAAAAAQRSFPDGVWLVELAEIHDPAAIVDVVAGDLGIHDHSSGEQQDRVVTALSSRTGLLVLDNCEQVIDAVADLVKVLLTRCPNLRILATSRESLSLRGESVIAVAPLATPTREDAPSLRSIARSDAIMLFAERATASVSSFQLTEANSATIAQICERLDGLPLAIELAAARLRALSPEQILQRLTDRYALLTHGRRGAPDRQQTLRWSIGWSYDLCASDEQQLWRELSLFYGGFELDAAEYVCGDELLDRLASLVDKSIVIREETDNVVRFRMLDTVREFGRDLIESADGFTDLQRRHRDWYLQMAVDAEAEWISPHQLEWSARLRRDILNLRQALEFSLTLADEGALVISAALRPFWIARGMVTVGRRWLDRALDLPGTQPAVRRAKAFYALCTLAAYQGDLSAANARARQARDLDAQQPDPATHAFVSIADGMTALCSEEPTRALAALHEAADGFSALGELRMHIATLIYLGWAYHQDDQPTQALAVHEQALTLAQPHGEFVYRTYALWSSGLDVWKVGDSDRATQLLEDGIRLTRLTDDPVMTFMCLQALSWIFAERGDLRRSAVLMGAADALSRRIGNAPVFFPKLTVYRREFEADVRKQLGSKKFDDANGEGRSMTTDEAISCALGEASDQPAPAQKDSPTLTKRERQVAELVAEGLTNKAIAGRLVIAQRTAEGHVDHILTKLGFTSRAQIAAWVARQGRRGNGEI